MCYGGYVQIGGECMHMMLMLVAVVYLFVLYLLTLFRRCRVALLHKGSASDRTD
jgi:hypothetical protein